MHFFSVDWFSFFGSIFDQGTNWNARVSHNGKKPVAKSFVNPFNKSTNSMFRKQRYFVTFKTHKTALLRTLHENLQQQIKRTNKLTPYASSRSLYFLQNTGRGLLSSASQVTDARSHISHVTVVKRHIDCLLSK